MIDRAGMPPQCSRNPAIEYDDRNPKGLPQLEIGATLAAGQVLTERVLDSPSLDSACFDSASSGLKPLMESICDNDSKNQRTIDNG
jgi:hypothetical protein